jgi:hypothetical protein
MMCSFAYADTDPLPGYSRGLQKHARNRPFEKARTAPEKGVSSGIAM